MTPQGTSQPSLLMTTIEELRSSVIQKYGTEGVGVIDTYHPDYLFRKQVSIEDCFFGNYPTLSELGAQFDKKFPAAWLMLHLNDLSEFCGCKEKLQGHPLQQCASVISTEFYFLKISELMLFFHRFKSGRYGRFYGSVDPLVITTSLRDFLKERIRAYDEREKAEKEKADREAAKNAITWKEYCMKHFGELRTHPMLRKTEEEKKAAKAKKAKQAKQPEYSKEAFEMALSIETDGIADKYTKKIYVEKYKKNHGLTPKEYIKKYGDRQDT